MGLKILIKNPHTKTPQNIIHSKNKVIPVTGRGGLRVVRC
jgi:hypothetical protein